MKFNRSFMFLIALLATVAISGSSAEEKVSEPFKYSGYSEAEYEGIRKFSEYVPMSDGEKLAIDVYVPEKGPTGSFPVIIEYTPYTRAFIDVKNGPIHKGIRKAVLKTDSPVLDLLAVPGGMGKGIREVMGHGYAFVRADMRGCGASTGWAADFMPRIGQDGGELVDWIAEQPWCDGNVGMVGGSYSGYSQIVTAGWAGPALKAIVPVVVPLDGYNGEVYPGGVYLWKFMNDYSEGLGILKLNYYTLDPVAQILGTEKRMYLPAAPVVDEDGDGDLHDEIPIDKNRNGTFLDDYKYPEDPGDPPKYKDGSSREHVYYLATKDHQENANYHRWAQSILYIDAKMPAPVHDYSSYHFSPSSQVPKIMKKDIAVYNIGGWHDTFTRGTTEYYCTMKDSNPSRMMVHAGYHGGGGPYWEYFGEDGHNSMKLILPEVMRFFDFYLKGIDNGIDEEPPVLIYVQNGEGWRQEETWPLEREKPEWFYFGSGKSLSRENGGEGKDNYRADYSHDSRYGKEKGNRYLGAMGGTPDKLPVRDKLDAKSLTYTSAPLTRDMEVTGHPIIKFWVSSSANYGDFFVYLTDVEPEGRSVLVTEGVLRAGFAKMVDNDESILGGTTGVNVLPDLPWHGYEASDYVPEIFKGGNVVELEFDMKPTSWVFREGHRVRVAIACADWPTFRLHPRLSTDNDPDNPAVIVPTITVHRGDAMPSGIRLPIIPE